MTAQPLEQHTYLPEQPTEVAEVLSFLDAHDAVRRSKPARRYLLAGADEHDSVEIPESVYPVLRQVLEAMKAGKAVTVVPQNQLLTTQQAADLLGVSRPTVVKLISEGKLPSETPGTRRRMIKLDDLLAYRTQRRDEQYRALMRTSVDLDTEFEEDSEAMAAQFRQIRTEVAAERANAKV